MQVNGTNTPPLAGSVAMLKSANEQTKLAGDLISKTVESMAQIQAAQSPAQRMDIAEITGIGQIINITA